MEALRYPCIINLNIHILFTVIMCGGNAITASTWRVVLMRIITCSHHSAHAFWTTVLYIDGLVQDCSISIADTVEILQSCTKPLICVEAV